MYPTPTASDGTGGPGHGKKMQGGESLRTVIQNKYPTPCARDFRSSKQKNLKSNQLNTFVESQERKKYPTPTKEDYRRRGPNSRQQGLPEQFDKSTGQLNPEWVEWLMGWPIGWTSLEPLSREAFEIWKNLSLDGVWWNLDPADYGIIARTIKIPRKERTQGADRRERIKALGNGQVPLSLRLAWGVLVEQNVNGFRR